MGEKNYSVHEKAIVATDRIGDGTRIWAFCNVMQGSVIGADCNICDHCYIESGVTIGDRVTVKNGVSLWDGMTIEDDVFIGPHAVFTNDVFPRSKVHHEIDRITISQGATIGAGAVIVAGHDIGRWAFIGAGAVVTKNVPDFSLWLGNPARMVGYVCKCARRLEITLNKQGDMQTRSTCKCGRSYHLIGDTLVCDDNSTSG